MGYFDSENDIKTMTGSLGNGLSADTSYGRRIIRYNFEINDEKAPFTQKFIENVLNVTMQDHKKNVEEINRLYAFYLGNQNILNRTDKKIRADIDNRIVENWAKYIADFKLGFIYGEPTQIIRNARAETTGEESDVDKALDKAINELSELLQAGDKHAVDKETGLWTVVTGVGYTSCIPTPAGQEEPFIQNALDPRTTYIIHSGDFKKEPIMAVTFSVNNKIDASGEKKNTQEWYFVIYTKNYSYAFKTNESYEVTETESKKFDVQPLVLKKIPIVEFCYDDNRMGCFESITSLLNAINLVQSDRMNDIVQAVQWFMKFINVDIDEQLYDQFKAKGVIKAKGEPGMPPIIEVVTATLDQQQVQVFKSDMVRVALILTKVPERNADPGDNTGQALVIGQGWADAESDAKNVEVSLKKAQKELVRLAVRICNYNASYKNIGSINTLKVDVKFTRNRSDNLIIKTQALKNLIDTGVAPLIAFKLSGLFDDPQKALDISQPYITKYLDVLFQKKEPAGTGTSTGNEFNDAEKKQKEIDGGKK